MPAPKTQVAEIRYAFLPRRSEVHPSAAIVTSDAPAPTKRARPNGPGERPKEPPRSAKSTAKHPQNRPKKPKAKSSSTSNPFASVLARTPSLSISSVHRKDGSFTCRALQVLTRKCRTYLRVAIRRVVRVPETEHVHCVLDPGCASRRVFEAVPAALARGHMP